MNLRSHIGACSKIQKPSEFSLEYRCKCKKAGYLLYFAILVAKRIDTPVWVGTDKAKLQS
jgi:hypothetical protein